MAANGVEVSGTMVGDAGSLLGGVGDGGGDGGDGGDGGSGGDGGDGGDGHVGLQIGKQQERRDIPAASLGSARDDQRANDAYHGSQERAEQVLPVMKCRQYRSVMRCHLRAYQF